MHSSRRFFRTVVNLVIALIALGALPSFVNAADDEASAAIRTSIDEVLTAAYAQPGVAPTPAQIRPYLARCVAFELVTRQAMGPGWKQFSAADQKRVTELFTELLIRTYSRRIIGTKRPKIVYGTPVRISAEREELPTRVTTSLTSDPFPVTYRVAKLSQGWRIYDIVIEGISFVANYRAQFDDLIKKGGAVAVIHSLETKLASANS